MRPRILERGVKVDEAGLSVEGDNDDDDDDDDDAVSINESKSGDDDDCHSVHSDV